MNKGNFNLDDLDFGDLSQDAGLQDGQGDQVDEAIDDYYSDQDVYGPEYEDEDDESGEGMIINSRDDQHALMNQQIGR